MNVHESSEITSKLIPKLKSKDLPKISIVTPSYNQGAYIEDTIRSVLDQAYPNLEYIIIDGGSSDQSLEVIRKYETKLNYWVSEPDEGQSDAIIKGFERCTGELLLWLNSDDLLIEGSLEKVAKIWLEHPDAALITGGSYKVTDLAQVPQESNQDAQTFKELSLNDLSYQNPIVQPSTFIDRRIFNKLGGIDRGFHHSMDYDYWLKVSANGYKIILTNHSLSVFRLHDACKSMASPHRFLTEDLIVAIRYLTFLPTLSRVIRYIEYQIKNAHIHQYSLLRTNLISDLENSTKSELDINESIIHMGILLALRNTSAISMPGLWFTNLRHSYTKPALFFKSMNALINYRE